MNYNWIEIVETLQPYLKCNSTEPKYQQEIENCLKFLGWRTSNKTMQSQVTINIGRKNSIRPDIVLYNRNGDPVLPIEIKRPNNICNSKQESQLMSYMRQLRLNVGLYIGENIQLYYDNPNDLDSPISVFKVEFCKDDKNGDVFCEMLFNEKFDINNIEDFCKEHYNRIIARNNLQQRLEEFFFSGSATKNIIALIKDKFIKEGYDDNVLNDELNKLEINVQWKEKTCMHNLISSPSTLENNNIVQDAYFSFDGINYHCKRRFVLELIKDYIANNPNISFEELEILFPAELHTKSLGVIRTLSSVNERIISQPDLKKRYFLKDNEIITLADRTKVVVNNQWGTLFPKFLKKAKSLYHITSCAEKRNIEVTKEVADKIHASKLKISFDNGSTIMEHDAVSTFKMFVENIGITQVASLNLRGRKDIPLISKKISNEYHHFQHPMNNGYFLFLNYSTLRLKKTYRNYCF